MPPPAPTCTTYLPNTFTRRALCCSPAGLSHGMTTRTSPRVAVVNREFARKIFGSVTKAIGGYYKMPDGTRIQVVGVAEDGKYGSLTEDPQPAMFLPILQWPSNSDMAGSAIEPRSAATGRAIRAHAARNWMQGCRLRLKCAYDEMATALFPPQMASRVAGCDGRDRRDAVDHWHLRDGCLLGQQAAAGAGNSRRPRRTAEASVDRRHWDGLSNCSLLVRQQDCSSECWQAGFWLRSYIRPLPAIRWFWPVLFWLCRCWDCWLRGFQRDARCRLIP